MRVAPDIPGTGDAAVGIPVRTEALVFRAWRLAGTEQAEADKPCKQPAWRLSALGRLAHAQAGPGAMRASGVGGGVLQGISSIRVLA